MADYTAEVLVIGGGIAGITAALELLDRGRDVLILDRDEEGNFGGLAKESFGGLFFVNSREQQRNGIKDTPALALRDWHSFAEFGPDDRLPKLWAETYVERCIPENPTLEPVVPGHKIACWVDVTGGREPHAEPLAQGV